MNNKKADKKRQQRLSYEHEGWVKGHEEGMGARKNEIQELQSVLEIKNAMIKALSGKSPIKDSKGALDLAWELAHPVKAHQVLPEGTACLYRLDDGYQIHETSEGMTARESWTDIRTLDPLPEPDPEPDWLDAPAVLARVRGYHILFTWVPVDGPRHHRWHSPIKGEGETYDWQDLTDVTPLYPKGQDR